MTVRRYSEKNHISRNLLPKSARSRSPQKRGTNRVFPREAARTSSGILRTLPGISGTRKNIPRVPSNTEKPLRDTETSPIS